MSKCPKCGVSSDVIPIILHWKDVMRSLRDFKSEIENFLETYDELIEKEHESSFSKRFRP